MDAELRSLIIVLWLNFTLIILAIPLFTWYQYIRNRKNKTTQNKRKHRTHSDGLLADEEDVKLKDDNGENFAHWIGDHETLSSNSLNDIDYTCLNMYKEKSKVLPKLDQCLFKWIYQLYKINDRQIFQLTPADGYLYLYFLKGASLLFFILTVLNWGILIPIYAGEGRIGAKNNLQLLTIGNIVDDVKHSKMWAVFSVTIIVSLLTYIFIYKQKQRIDKVNYLTYDTSLSDLDVSKYTLLIRNVPKSLRSTDGDNILFHFFREFYRDQVICAHIIPNLSDLEQAMEQRNYNLKKLGYYVEFNNKNGKRATISAGPKVLCWRHEKTDAVNYYKKKIQEIDRLIPRLKNIGFKENTGVAYVTFWSKEILQKAIKDFKFLKSNPMGFINKQLRVQDWKIENCSSPSDTIWRNLNKNYKSRYFRKIQIYFTSLVISFLCITPLTIIDKLDYIRIEEEDFNIFSIVLESYISPLLLFFISSLFIPWVIRKISEYENPELKSRKESTIMNKNYVFIFLNSTIVPLINLTMLQAFIISRDIDYNGFLERVSHSTEFLLRYLIQITFVSWTIQLLASPYFATKKFKKWVNNEYSDENWQFQEWFFNIGYSVPYNAAIFTMVLAFSTVAPLVLPFGSVFFFIKYMLDKYNLIYVCPEQFESAGKISRNKPISYSIIAVCLYQFSMMVVFILAAQKAEKCKFTTTLIWFLIFLYSHRWPTNVYCPRRFLNFWIVSNPLTH